MMKNAWDEWGNNAQRRSANERLSTGANMNGSRLATVGLACSFTNNLIASANGTGRPINPGLFGPFRVWK